MDSKPFHYCPFCGEPGLQASEGKRHDCPACGSVFYRNPAAACAVFIEKDGLLLFARRARDPGKGLLDLPGGFIDPQESAEAALCRELREELGLSIDPRRLAYACSFPNRYPYAGVVYATCDLFFSLALRDDDGPPRAADDVAEALWLNPAEIRPADLAFESMRQAMAWYLKRKQTCA